MIRRIKALQNHPTSRSCPHKQAGTLRNPFEMDFICNNILHTYLLINLSMKSKKEELLGKEKKNNFAVPKGLMR